MRLTEFPHILLIKDQYIALRTNGCSREDATEKLMLHIAALPSDEQLTAWIGLADGQFFRKELTLEVAQQGLLALHRLLLQFAEITPGDIERRRKHYIQAPMPERKLGRPRKEAT